MARVTVEDCLQVVNDRFELILFASAQSRRLHSEYKGFEPQSNEIKVKEKTTVTSLRDIAENRVDLDDLRDSLISKMQHFVIPEDAEEAPDFSLEQGASRVLPQVVFGSTDSDEEEKEEAAPSGSKEAVFSDNEFDFATLLSSLGEIEETEGFSVEEADLSET